ncbi:putative disease resistance RPP13-like protein 3 [Brachypodium distachyon]|uniref:putative disease resistance RPP13-like protein 3 n=1 Tax=Brachypodium distachyon TaxID=15368 RepID=UPI000D0CF186|nr:putative disease resistance RPP13-like protein 3 [Brachypodium distachyon]|eukprot:XP_024317546.1 putative disease resistance RPP13-like protein 3 [Brachypodium distachyon]
METALVGVATGVIKPVLSKLTDMLEKECARLKSVNRNTQFLRGEMRSMSATLQIIADSEELDREVIIWRDDVRELSFDMEDCIDDIMARVDQTRESSTGLDKFFEKMNTWTKLKGQHKMANMLEELKARAIEASEKHKRYNFAPPTHHSGQSAIDPRLQALFVEVDKLVGMDGPKEHIVRQLTRERVVGSSGQLQVVSIVGAGGLGKTTLANQVYHTIKSQFPHAAFVSISCNPDIKKILRDIAKGVGISEKTPDDDVENLIHRLREHLQDKRYFIVIDDLWDTEAWKIIRLGLVNNDHGSKIITTTRNIAVASCCCSQQGHIYEMKPLSFDDSKRLFFTRAFGSDDLCYPHLAEVSKQILEKCAGLPLAIITLSSLLADEHAEDKWNRVLAIIGSALAKDPGADKMTKILSLSYFDLPHHLRTCFLYLSLYPEDYQINKQSLINKWIAEGFIHEIQGWSKHELGETYFNDLINRSLIQPINVKYGQTKACRVHDIILDFIKCKAAQENFVTSFDDVEHRDTSGHRLVRRLSVNSLKNGKVALLISPILSHVRSLAVFGDLVQYSLRSFPALRMLDLAECSELENRHLTNIGKLFLLKYLRIGQCQITELPKEIGELRYLETLDISGTRIYKLPSTFTNLKRLVRLYAPRYSSFPYGVIGQMQNLEELEDLGVNKPMVSGVFSELEKSLQEFGQLTKLRTLGVHFHFYSLHLPKSGTQGVEGLERYVGALIASCKVHHLYFNYEYDGLWYPHPLSLEPWCSTTPCSLRKLHITHCFLDKVPKWMSELGNLRELNLCILIMKPKDVAVLGAMPTLVFLELETFYGASRRIFFIHGGFRSLKYLKLIISRCGTAVEFGARSMPKLEHLKLYLKVHKRECVNGAFDFGIQHLSALTKIDISIFGRHNFHVKKRIETAIMTLNRRPTLSFEHTYRGRSQCEHFEEFVNSYGAIYGVPTEMIRSFHAEQDKV